jgi:subtilisin-like proprotein convertase family protein
MDRFSKVVGVDSWSFAGGCHRLASVGFVFGLLLAPALVRDGLAFRRAERPDALEKKTFRDPALSPRPFVRSLEETPEFEAEREIWSRLLAANSGGGARGRWSVWIDPRGGGPALVEGAGIPWIAGRGNQIASTGDAGLPELERKARELVATWAPIFKVRAEELVLSTASSGRMTPDLWYVNFDRRHRGIPVEESRLSFRVGHGNLIQFGGTGLVSLDSTSTVPKLDSAEAWQRLWTFLGDARPPVVELEGEGSLSIVLEGAPEENAGLYLGPTGEGFRPRLVWVLRFRARGASSTYVARVDAAGEEPGRVLSFESETKSARVTGGVFPVSNDGSCPSGCEQPGTPMPFATVTPGGTTNSAGIYAWPGGTVSVNLSGPYVRISDTCGAVAESGGSAAEGNLDLGVGSGTDCATPSGHSAGDTHSSRTTFYGINRIAEAARSWLPANSWLKAQLRANVNLNQTCNAYWDGASINMFRSAPGYCGNTGEILAVIDHEWGHGLDENDGGPGPMASPVEAFADAVFALQLGSSCVGRGFYANGSNCDGYGDACTACTGIRDIDWARHASGAPHTPQNFVGSCGSGSYNGPCGGEDHCESHPSSEAVWDLLARDLPAHPMEPSEALVLANKFFYLSAPSAGPDLYNCTGWCPSCQTDGCNAGAWFTLFRLIDDGDGNLANGTPHAAELFAAFSRHAIACGTVSDPSNQDSAECGTVGSSTLSGRAGNDTAVLDWTAAAGASSYALFRSEVGCAAGWNRIATTTLRSYVDSEVANGSTYSYRVQAVGASSACLGPISSCVTVVPRPFAGVVRFGRDRYSCATTLDVDVLDAGPAPPSTVPVTVESSTEPAGETFLLAESSPGSGRYAGSFPTTAASPSAGDGALSLVHGDSIVVRYADPDDGSGGPANVSDTAVADCIPPVLSNVQVVEITSNSARVTWTTNEPASSTVSVGAVPPPGTQIADPSLVTNHSVLLSGLTPCTKYFASVTSTDLAGNPVSDSNGGAYHQFRTGDSVLLAPASTDVPKSIPTPGTISSSLPVAENLGIEDVDVTLTLTHPYDTSLKATLIHPDGTRVLLFAQVGGSGSNFTGTTLDDEAAGPIGSGTAPFSGKYRPAEALSLLDGKPAAGSWKLELTDLYGYYQGNLVSWSLGLTLSDPLACPWSDGWIQIEKGTYSCSGTLNLLMQDVDLSGSSAATVTVASTREPSGESVVLAETPANTGRFRGSLPATAAPPVAGDGLLSLGDGDAITATYVDADDGGGGTNVTKIDTALADCRGPAISAVTVREITGGSARIEWITDEPSTSRVELGTSCPSRPLSRSDATLATSHSLVVGGLAPLTAYDLAVTSGDPFGNVTTDDAAGGCYTFTTTDLVPNVYVADTSGRNVSRLDPTGTVIDVPLDTSDGLTRPHGLAFLPDGRLLTTDYSARVFVSEQDGSGISVFADSSDGLGQPYGIAVSPAGGVYVADYGVSRVLKFDESGALLATFATGISGPVGIAFDPAGNWLVANYSSSSIGSYDSDDTYLGVFASSAKGINFPEGIVWDPGRAGWLLFNSGANSILRFDADGTPAGVFADSSDGLYYPNWGSWDSNGELLVASSGNSQVLRFDEAGNRLGVFADSSDGFSFPYGLAVLGQLPLNSSRGVLRLSPDPVGCSGILSLRLLDADLDTDPGSIQTVTVEVSSGTEPGPELVSLVEKGISSIVFEGSIGLSLIDSPGVLRIVPGDTVTGLYRDADDGSGVPATVTDQALVGSDCTPPVISNVRATDAASSSVVVRWQTDEASDSRVEYGPTPALGLTAAASGSVLSHAVTLTGLSSCATYYFRVSSADVLGNRSTDDNGGLRYRFETAMAVLFVAEGFESGGAGWSHSGTLDEWQLGTPTSGPGSAHGGTQAWATNLSGPYSRSGGATNGDFSVISPPIDLAAAGAATLSFWHWYDIWNDANPDGQDDGAWLEISSDGGSTWALLTPEGGYNNTLDYEAPRPYGACWSGTTAAWSEVRADLAAFVGRVVQLRFRFWAEGDEGSPRAGWYLDDVRISTDFPCHRGTILISSDSATCEGTLSFRVADADLDTDPGSVQSIVVAVSSGAEPGPEAVTLTETGASSVLFEGSLPFSQIDSPGVLRIVPGDTATAVYQDADDGTGAPSTVTASAAVGLDCIPPVISNVRVTDATSGSAVVRWETNEGSDSRVEYGPTPALGLTAAAAGSVLSHAVTVTGLASCTTYNFRVSSTDVHGNETTDDNGGLHYRFETAMVVLFVDEGFESGGAGWSHSGTLDEWQLGTPTSGPGSAHGGTKAWATNLSGPYSRSGGATNGDFSVTSPPIDLTSSGAATLSFWHWYDIWNDGVIDATDDGAWLEISSDGGSTWEFLTPEGGYNNTLDGEAPRPYEACWSGTTTAWSEVRADLGAFTGKVVRLKFRFWSEGDEGSPRAGWYFDDVRVSTDFPCHRGTILISSDSATCEGTLSIRVADADLDTDPGSVQSIVVAVSSGAEPGGEAVTLTETGASSVLFEGSLPFSQIDSPGALGIVPGDTATAVYQDADDGTGAPSTVTASAAVGLDCIPPVISNVRVTDVTSGSAVVRWETNEASDSLVEYGPTPALGLSASVSAPLLSHAVTLTGLSGCTTYHFRVSSADPLGNGTTDDDGGLHYRFETATLALFVDEGFETGGSGWNHSGTLDEWQLGTPTSGPGSAHGGTKAWATNLSGPYTRSGGATNGDFSVISPSIDLASAGAATLSFWHWYDIWNDATVDGQDDGAWLEISSDGGSTWALLTPEGGYNNTLDYEAPRAYGACWSGTTGAWSEVRADLAAFVGRAVQLRFRFWSEGDEGSSRAGWYFDDVRVSKEIPCGPDPQHVSSQAIDLPSGNGDGVVDPGEEIHLVTDLRNGGNETARAIVGHLSTTTPGVDISTGDALFPDLAPAAAGSSAVPHFVFRVAPSVPCGTIIEFRIVSDFEDPSGNAGQSQGLFTFQVGAIGGGSSVPVAIFDHPSQSDISYWTGGNSNLWAEFRTILDSDPRGRFSTGILTQLDAGSLAPYAVLFLPDNAVPDASLSAVDGWFVPGKTIVAVDSAACYAAYSGFLWPASAGSNGWGTRWTYGSGYYQRILRDDPVTEGYSVGQQISSEYGDSQAIAAQVPADAVALLQNADSSGGVTVLYRDVPGRGRIILLGPVSPAGTDNEPLVRNATAPFFWSCHPYTSTVPTGLVNNAAVDLDSCADTGVRISWERDAGSWEDGGVGSRSYDVLRDGAAILSGIAYGTTSAVDTTAPNETTSVYSVRYNNGIGFSSMTFGASASDEICVPIVRFDQTSDPGSTLAEICGDGDSVVEPGEEWGVAIRLENVGDAAATGTFAELAVNSGSAVSAVVSGNPGSFGNLAANGGASTASFRFLVSRGAACVADVLFDVAKVRSTEGIFPDRPAAFSVPVGTTLLQHEAAEQQTTPLRVTSAEVGSDLLPAFTGSSPVASATLTYTTGYVAKPGVVTVLFGPDDFASAANWSSVGGGIISQAKCAASVPVPSNSCFQLDKDTSLTLASAVSTVGFTNVRVVFDGGVQLAGATLNLDWSPNGTSWYNGVWSTTSTAWLCDQDVPLPAAAEGNPGFRIRFRGTSAGAAFQRTKVDFVKIVATALPTGSFSSNARVSLVDPSNHATVVKPFGAADAGTHDVAHLFTGPGTYRVRLEENGGGEASLAGARLEVVDSIPECDVASCAASTAPPPVPDSGTLAARFRENADGNTMTVTWDVTHCHAAKAILLRGDLSSFAGNPTPYAGCADPDLGVGGTDGAVDVSGLQDAWFNVVWTDGTTAGHPGWAFDGTSRIARTWKATAFCSVRSDDPSNGACP